MVRSSNGNWLYKRGDKWPKERFWVNCLDKNGSINLSDTELRKLGIGTGCTRFLMYRGSPDSKDLLANKLILYSILAFTGKKFISIALGVILSVLYLDIFTMNLTASFRIIWRPCASVLRSPYSKALRWSICVRIKPWTSFSLDSLSINFDLFAIFKGPPVAFFFTAATWYLRVEFSTKTTPRFFSFVHRIILVWSSFQFEGRSMFLNWKGISTTIMLVLSLFNFSFLLNIHVCTALWTLLGFGTHWSSLSSLKYICASST